MDYKVAVAVGRFQIFHNSHYRIIREGLEVAEKVLILIGSYKNAPTPKNPFTFEERKALISSAFSENDLSRIIFEPVRDYFYKEDLWIAEVQAKVLKYANDGDCICLLGNYKDSSSYYLKFFPQWESVHPKTDYSLNATDIRNLIFNPLVGLDSYKNKIPEGCAKWLLDNFLGTSKHNRLTEQKRYYDGYPEEAKRYPRLEVTVDAVVICSGHILVVRRKERASEDLLALPGGFVKPSETLETAALRELKEETGIKVPNLSLKSKIKESRVFDYPGRSLKGRVITHAFLIRLDDGFLPEVRGGDDAKEALWMSIMEIMSREDEFYEDHLQIIRHFVN